MPAVPMVVVPMPWAVAADLARTVIGPDHPAVTMWISIIARVVVIGRRVEAAMKVVMPEGRRRAIAAIADAAEAIAAAVDDRSGTKTAAMECGTAASESTAMNRRTAAMEATTAVKTTATVEAATMTTTATMT